MPDNDEPAIPPASDVDEYAEQLRQWAIGCGAMNLEQGGANTIDASAAYPGIEADSAANILYHRGISFLAWYGSNKPQIRVRFLPEYAQYFHNIPRNFQGYKVRLIEARHPVAL